MEATYMFQQVEKLTKGFDRCGKKFKGFGDFDIAF